VDFRFRIHGLEWVRHLAKRSRVRSDQSP
jgi:hypothetical protein